MMTPNRIAYFKLEKVGFFSGGTAWKKDVCRPLNNPQARILMDKPPVGWRPPPRSPQETAAGPTIDPAKAEKKTQNQSPDAPKPVAPANGRGEEEDCRTPPRFDMLDLPDAMEKMGFPVGARLARRWFGGRKNILSEDAAASYPADMVDTKNVSLDFVLKHKGVAAKLEKLIQKDIYSENARNFMKKVIRRVVEKKFLIDGESFNGFIDSLSMSGGDIQQLHHYFQFQKQPVGTLDTLSENFGMTDLTASLGNFSFMAAVAVAKVASEKFYKYGIGPPAYCCESSVEISHIYVYVKDSYSFADDPGKKSSQYLGHWNLHGVIWVPAAVVGDVINSATATRGTDFQFGDQPERPLIFPYVYDNGFKKPVDIMNGLFRRQRRRDVYYPVHNSNYNAWRDKFDRGGDFVIYSEPRKIKLPNAIKFTLDPICKPAKELGVSR